MPHSQKNKVTPNTYLFRVNTLNLFWFENVFIHSKVCTALEVDFGLFICDVFNCDFNKWNADVDSVPRFLLPTVMRAVFLQSDKTSVRWPFDSVVSVSLTEGSSAPFMNVILLKDILLC